MKINGGQKVRQAILQTTRENNLGEAHCHVACAVRARLRVVRHLKVTPNPHPADRTTDAAIKVPCALPLSCKNIFIFGAFECYGLCA